MRSYNDPAKQKSREKLEAFIRTHLAFKKPRDIRVVCFPGAETEGEEALEVKHVYDAIGIPRRNIIGLEYDRENAERLRNANLGITVVESDARSFFNTTTKQFDIISLDYTGQQTEDEINTLMDINSRNVLTNTGIVCTVYAAKRESTATKLRMGQPLTPAEIVQMNEYIGMPDRSSEDEWDQEKDAADLRIRRERWKEVSLKIEERERQLKEKIEKKEISLSELRDGITLMTIQALAGAHRDELEALFTDTDELEPISARILQTTNLRDYFAIPGAGPTPEEVIAKTARRLQDELCTRYVGRSAIAAIERYGYTSNSNYLMLMDLFVAKRDTKHAAIVDDIIVYDAKKHTIILNPNKRRKLPFTLQLMNLITNPSPRTESYLPAKELPPRIDLGSSYVRKEKIRPSEALELIQGGTPLDEITAVYQFTRKDLDSNEVLAFVDAGVPVDQMESYFGIGKMQIAGYRAHRTRAEKA